MCNLAVYCYFSDFWDKVLYLILWFLFPFVSSPVDRFIAMGSCSWQCFAFFKELIIFIFWAWVIYLHVDKCALCTQCPQRPEGNIGSLRTGVKGFKPSCGWREPKPSPLRESSVLLIIEPFFQPWCSDVLSPVPRSLNFTLYWES